MPEDLFAELEANTEHPDMLIITEEEGSIEVSAPFDGLDSNTRVAMLLRALITELADEIVAALETTTEEDDD